MCLPRTQQPAGARAHLWRFAHDDLGLDQKKVARLPPLSETLIVPDPTDPASMTLELDELWSFVAKKTNQSWIWIALCRRSHQVVAYAIGDRSEDTCRRLWNAIPATYRCGHCFTDFWAAYQAVIPEEQHTAVGKETGQTTHVERWKIPCVNVWLASSAKRCPFPSQPCCMRPAFSSFFTATTWTGLSVSCEPLLRAVWCRPPPEPARGCRLLILRAASRSHAGETPRCKRPS